ncbi:hypothetical protein ACQ4PT_045254 [Festuca glaucescens]
MATAEAALLREKATLLREAMWRSEAVREQAVASVGGRMAAVDAAVRPAQERTRNACILHDNVARSIQAVQDIVRQFDLVREAEPVISTGPSIGISAYLETVDKLRGAKDFFTTKIRCKAGDDVLRRVNELLPKVAVELENEFSRLLSKCRDIRSSTLELTLKQLGVEYVTVEEVETVQAENLSAKVDQWIQCLQIAVILLNSDHISYESSLKVIFQEPSNGGETIFGLASEITGIIHALETNLEVKAKHYKDLPLGNLFLMNNISYIVRSIGSSKVRDLFGNDWIPRRRKIVQQHATQYKRVDWAKVLECLSAQGLTSSLGSSTEGILGSIGNTGSYSGTTSTSVIKARFRSFNKQFEEVCETQINWAIPDMELRDNLILAVAEILSPAYTSFVKRFGPLVENSKNPSKYIKYTPEALEQALGNLFAKKLVQ